MTRVAMTVIWMPIRTLLGIWKRTMLMMRLEKAVTSVTQMAMTKAVAIWPVTASDEQMPRTSRAMGLRLKIESVSSSRLVSAIGCHPSSAIG